MVAELKADCNKGVNACKVQLEWSSRTGNDERVVSQVAVLIQMPEKNAPLVLVGRIHERGPISSIDENNEKVEGHKR